MSSSSFLWESIEAISGRNLQYLQNPALLLMEPGEMGIGNQCNGSELAEFECHNDGTVTKDGEKCTVRLNETR